MARLPRTVTKISIVGALLTGAGLLVAVDSNPASASTATAALWTIGYGSSYVYNYDFDGQNPVQTNVDWPVNLVYWNNAEIDKVKHVLDNSPDYDSSGSVKWGYVYDGAGIIADTDSGLKAVTCPVNSTVPHTRFYADGDDRLYDASSGIGYWIVATTHKDTNECALSGKKYTASEAVENDIRTKFAGWGYSTQNEHQNFHNYEAYRVEGLHYWGSSLGSGGVHVPDSGFADYINIP